MNLDMDTVDHALRWLQVVVVPLFLYIRSQFSSLRSDMAEFKAKKDKELKELNERITRNEAALCNLPDNKAMHDLALAVERLRSDVVGMGAELGGLKNLVEKVDRIVERQEDHLLNGGK